MEYLQIISGLIAFIRGALKGTAAWAQAEAFIDKIDADLTAMQADGRNPTEAERAAILATLDELAKQPAQGT